MADPCTGYRQTGDREEHPQTLVERLDHLKQSAITAWNLAEGAKARDREDWLLDMADQTTSWRNLPGKWQDLVDALLDVLEGGRTDAERLVLVVPIDDLDLQTLQVRELLMAFRFLRHPQLVFLVTGYMGLLLNEVALTVGRDFQTEMIVAEDVKLWWVGALEPSDEEEVGSASTAAHRLARELCHKIVPPPHQWSMPTLNLKEALKAKVLEIRRGEYVSLGDVLGTLEWEPPPSFDRLTAVGDLATALAALAATPYNLGQHAVWLTDRALDLSSRTTFTFRQLTQLVEYLHSAVPVVSASQPEGVREMLESDLLSWYKQKPVSKLGVAFGARPRSFDRSPAPQLVSWTSGSARVATGRLTSSSLRGSDGRELTVEVRTIGDFAFQFGEEEPVPAPFPLLLALEAPPASRPRLTLRGRAVHPIIGRHPMITLHRDLGFQVPWPGPGLGEPSSALLEVELLLRASQAAGSPCSTDELAWRWLAVELTLLGVTLPATIPDPFSPAVSPPGSGPRAWEDSEQPQPPPAALLDLIRHATDPGTRSAEADGRFERWRQDSLPLLGLPEYGLSPAAQWAVLRACLGCDRGGMLVLAPHRKTAIEVARRRALAEAGPHLNMNAGDVIATIEADSSGLPWWCLTRRAVKGEAWWLDLVTPVVSSRGPSSIANLVLHRTYHAEGALKSRPAFSLFWIQSQPGATSYPHALTEAMDRLLAGGWEGASGAPPALSLAFRLASEAPPGNGGVALIVRTLHDWLCDLVVDRDSPNAELAARLRRRVLLVGDRLRLDQEAWRFTIGSRASFVVEDLVIPRYGRWRILGDGVDPRASGEAWHEASIALRGVIQSFIADSTPLDSSGTIPIELADAARTDTGPLERPPLRAWLDYEILLRVMDRACGWAETRSERNLSGSPIRRWLLAVFIDACGRLAAEDRGLLGSDPNWPFLVPYPVEDLDIFRKLCTRLVGLAREETVPEPTRHWARSALDSYARALDEVAADFWTATASRLFGAAPGRERVMKLLNEGQTEHFARARVTGIGFKLAAAIVAERERGGRFADYADLVRRVRGLGQRVMAALQALATHYDEHPELDPLT